MEMIKVTGFLPDSAKNSKHKTVARMEQLVISMAEENGGKLQRFEVPEPGTALLLVAGDQAMQFIMKEFKTLQNVTVSLVPALSVDLEKNKKVQEKVNRMRQSRRNNGLVAA